MHFIIKGEKPSSPEPSEDPQGYDDQQFVAMIDPLLIEWDVNKDGFIDYTEFVERN